MPSDHPDSFRDSHEDDIELHSFIVRIWLEETQSNPQLKIWRGHITYVNHGDRHYFNDINEIPGFIAPHLREVW